MESLAALSGASRRPISYISGLQGIKDRDRGYYPRVTGNVSTSRRSLLHESAEVVCALGAAAAIMQFSFPVEGFLGTGAPFAADLNLVAQAIMGIALMAGAVFARRKRYRAHGICQTSVLLLNLVLLAMVMWPAMREQVLPAFPRPFRRWYFAAPTIHAGVGMVAELMGLYVAAVAGTKLVPERLRFSNWKRWMRFELALWWAALLSGMSTYYVWYVASH